MTGVYRLRIGCQGFGSGWARGRRGGGGEWLHVFHCAHQIWLGIAGSPCYIKCLFFRYLSSLRELMMKSRLVLVLGGIFTLLQLSGIGHSARPLAAADELKPLDAADVYGAKKLLEVTINLPEKSWNKLRNESLDFVTAFGKGAFKSNYNYYFGDVSIGGRKLTGIEIRKKGFFGSSDAERPSLKIRVENADQVRLLGGTQRITLNNNKQDRSNASQLLSYNLFRAAGLPAPRSGLAKVTVNGTSLGVYTYLESIDAPFLQRTFQSDTGDLYEGVFPTDFVADRLDRFDVKTNKKGNDKADLKQIISILEKPGADLVSQLQKHFDIDEFVKYWALESLIGFWDGYAANQNNYYLYKNPKDGKFHFIPWGADMAFVPPFGAPGGQFGQAARKKSVFAKGLLAYQLNQNEAIRQKYQQAMLKLLDSVWDEKQLLAELDRVEALVKDHLHPSQGEIAESSKATRDFITNRRKEIMDEIKDGPIHITTPPGKSFYMREVGKAAAAFNTEWSAEAGKAAEGERVKMELILNGETVKFDKLAATSGPARFPGFGGPQRPGPMPPTVVISGVRQTDQKKVTLTLTFQPDQFGPASAEEINVQGMVTEGDGFSFGGMRSFMGKVTLKAAGQKDGDNVAGSLKGKLYEMRGGFGG